MRRERTQGSLLSCTAPYREKHEINYNPSVRPLPECRMKIRGPGPGTFFFICPLVKLSPVAGIKHEGGDALNVDPTNLVAPSTFTLAILLAGSSASTI